MGVLYKANLQDTDFFFWGACEYLKRGNRRTGKLVISYRLSISLNFFSNISGYPFRGGGFYFYTAFAVLCSTTFPVRWGGWNADCVHGCRDGQVAAFPLANGLVR